MIEKKKWSQKSDRGQQTAKLKKWIRAKKDETSAIKLRTKDRDISLELFLTSKVKKISTKLRQAFIKAPIFKHFDLERCIQIKTDAFNYTNGKILSQ